MWEDLEYHEPPLPFTWAELPRRRIDRGGHRVLAAMLPKYRFQDGKAARIDALHQYTTYGGNLCGVPELDEVRAAPVHAAMQLAAGMFPLEADKVRVLPPELFISAIRRQATGGPDRDVAFLPPVCSIALFRSGGEVGVVVWFQASFGPPEAGLIQPQLAEVAWAEIAMPWDP